MTPIDKPGVYDVPKGFLPIANYEGYFVSREGVVISFRKRGPGCGTKTKHKVLLPKPGHRGHLSVGLCIRGVVKQVFVHRIVLETFVGKCPDGMVACHFPDRNPSNNNLSNLRWDTRKANSADMDAHGTRYIPNGELSKSAKLTSRQVKEIRRQIANGRKQSELAEQFKVSRATICFINKGQTWKI
jgi:hypothetical protein